MVESHSSMSQKTRSLILLAGLLAVLAILVWIWRLQPARTVEQHITHQELFVGTTTNADFLLSTTGSPEFIPTPVTTTTSLIESTTTDVKATTTVSTNTTGTLRLLMVGDLMLDRTVATRTKQSGEPDYPFRKLPPGWTAGFDYSVANLEGSLTPTRRPPEKSIDFQFDPAWATILKDQGFDAFSQANNHALDQGSAGYADSVSRLRNAGFLVFGHQVDDGLIALATTTVNGQRLAFLGWNTTDNPIDLMQAKEAIGVAKAQADTMIAFMHWGLEYQDHPTADNVKLAHWLIDQGVDVVVGGHPHWVQGISIYQGKPIVWSLGNFVFDQDWSKETQQGLAIKLRITPDEVGITPVPLSIKLSQPKLEEGRALQDRLLSLAKISDEDVREEIMEGKELVFPRSIK